MTGEMMTFSSQDQGLQTNRYDDDVLAALARLGRRTFHEPPVAFYGSSSFRLWERMAEDLETLNIINLGFGGGTFESAHHYFDLLLAPAAPGRIVLYFGENDISNDGLRATTAINGYRRLRQRIREALGQIPIYYVSTKHSPAKWLYAAEVSELNRLALESCAEDASTHFVDCTTCLLGEHGRPIGKYYQPDNIHLNAAGYARWATVLRTTRGLFEVRR